jgi:hypothetical protein
MFANASPPPLTGLLLREQQYWLGHLGHAFLSLCARFLLPPLTKHTYGGIDQAGLTQISLHTYATELTHWL